MMKRLLLLGLLLASPAQAQFATTTTTAPVGDSTTRIASTQFVQQNISSPTNLSAAFDAAFCSTRGGILERSATGWACITPGTASLPFVSNGPGADPGYQALTNAGHATMLANTVKANPTGSTATPVDLGTSTGTKGCLFDCYNVNTIVGLDIAAGSSGSPITGAGPTVRISRIEDIASGTCVNLIDYECNATLAVYAGNTTADQQQVTAITAIAYGNATATGSPFPLPTAIYAIARGQPGSIQGVQGMYVEGRSDSTVAGTAAGAIEARVSNFSGFNVNYNSTGASGFPAISADVTGGTGSTPASVAYVAIGGTGLSTFHVGFAATAASVTDQDFRSDSSSATILQGNGSHTTGVDLTGATISGNAIQTVGFNLTATGGVIGMNPASGTASITLNPIAATQQAVVAFQQTNVGKWSIGKNTDNTFFLFDGSASANAITVAASATTSTGVISSSYTTASTSKTTGAMVLSGGLGVGGAIYGGAEIATAVTVVASLPTCNAAHQAARHFVTDQNTAVAYHGAVTGGGTNKQGVTCDGSAWYQD